MSGLIYPHKGLLMPRRVDLGGPIVTHRNSYGDANKRFTFTATGMNFGPASAGRIIAVGIGARKDSLFGSWSGVTSCTIAGIAATGGSKPERPSTSPVRGRSRYPGARRFRPI